MEPRKLVRIGGFAIGGVMVAGMLSVGIDGTQVSWMKGAVLESLGAHMPMVQMASHERQLEDVKPMHLVKRRPRGQTRPP